MQPERVPMDIEKLVAIAKTGAKHLEPSDLGREGELRGRCRELVKAGSLSEAVPVLNELAELTGRPRDLRQLARMLLREGEKRNAVRLLKALGPRAGVKRKPQARSHADDK
jgi:hypothetical protein